MEEKIRKLEEAEAALKELKKDEVFRKRLYECASDGYGSSRGSAGLACIGFYSAIDAVVKNIGLVKGVVEPVKRCAKS